MTITHPYVARLAGTVAIWCLVVLAVFLSNPALAGF